MNRREGAVDLNKLKILAVDDNRDNLTTLKAVLSDALPGCALSTALDGPRGIELARTEDPDAILLDIVMPNMDGFEVCSRLKAEERLRDIPVIFLTALRTDPESRVRALEVGGEGFLGKPLDAYELVAQIRAMAKVKAANRIRRMERDELAALVAERTRELEQELSERKRAEENLRRQTAVTKAINRVLQGALQVKTDVEVARICLSEAEELTSSMFGFIGELNQAGRMAAIALNDPGWEACRIPATQRTAIADMEVRGIFGRVLKDGKSLISNQPSTHPDWIGPPIGHPQLTAFLGVPLKLDGRTVGIVGLANKSSGYELHDQEAIEALSVALVEALQRKRAEESSKKSEQRYGLLFNCSNDAVFVSFIDGEKSGKFTEVNDVACARLGYSREQLLQMSPTDIAADGTEESRERALESISKTGRAVFEMVHLGRSGEKIPVEISSRVFENGGNRYVLSVVRDITERKRTEQERKRLQDQLQQALKMEAVGRLAGGIAHDFNNLLTAISGNISLALMDVKPDDPLADSLTQADLAAGRAASLTRQLLAFSRKQIVEPRVVNLNEIISSLHKMLVRLIGENIELQTVPEQALRSVRVDPGQFEQIVVNLAVNARDSMSNGGQLIIETANVDLDENDCSRHSDILPGEFVMLAVKDTGYGMSEEVKQHIFEPFFTTKATGQGTGLGLATIYGTVKQAGGSIEVFSEVGQGTSFKIYLPSVNHKAETLTVGSRALQLPRGNETILLVEDELAVRDIAMKSLKRLGYTVLLASNGQEALALLAQREGQIDLLFTDVIMPGMNGRQLWEQVTIRYPAVKTLFASGYTEDVIAHLGVVEEGLNFIGKPYTPRVLAMKVREVLGVAGKGLS